MERKQVSNLTANTVLMGERVYGDLPISVRVLIAAYATPIPSGNEGVFSFEVSVDDWNEIKSELTRLEHSVDAQGERFVLVTYYANDYYCPHDDAMWSVCNCSSAESDECPICSDALEPLTSESYIIIRPDSNAACGSSAGPVSASMVLAEPAWHNRELGEGGGER